MHGPAGKLFDFPDQLLDSRVQWHRSSMIQSEPPIIKGQVPFSSNDPYEFSHHTELIHRVWRES